MSARPWLHAYPEGVPADVDTRAYASLVELMQDSFQRFSDRTAFSFMGRDMSYAELDHLRDRRAHV